MRRSNPRPFRQSTPAPSPSDFPRASMSVELQDATDSLGSLTGRTDLLPWDSESEDAERDLRALLDAGYSILKTTRGREQLTNDERLKLLHAVAVVEHALGDDDGSDDE